jgi:hypothetical protein
MTTELDLMQEILEVEKELVISKAKLAEANRKWLERETEVISIKIKLDNLKEALRVNRDTYAGITFEKRDLEVEEFRQRNPEVCEMARQRDEDKANGQ